MAITATKRVRLYDFVNGTPAQADEVDAEFNQLILEENNTVDDLNSLQTQVTALGSTKANTADVVATYATKAELIEITQGGVADDSIDNDKLDPDVKVGSLAALDASITGVNRDNAVAALNQTISNVGTTIRSNISDLSFIVSMGGLIYI